MGLKEILKNLGYTDEQIKAVIDAMTENKLHVSSVENPEDTIRQLQEEKAALEGENAKLQKSPDRQTDPAGQSAAEEIRKLKETIQQGKINTKMIVELTKAHALDVDYMMYQAEKTGAVKGIKVDDNGNVFGVEELVENLKKSHSGQFEVAAQENGASMKRTGIKKLENAAQAEDVPQTLEEAIAQKYSGEEE